MTHVAARAERRRTRLLLALMASASIGMTVMLARLQPDAPIVATVDSAIDPRPVAVVRSAPPPAAAGAAPQVRPAPVPDDRVVLDLRARQLTVPVDGVTRQALTNTFGDARDRTRQHEAMDILAPRGTRVVAVEDGEIVKLFTSDRGGLTIYQFDPARVYAYYYAHLDSYAPDLAEGMRVERGRVIGVVGTTGNAPKDTPHLHFAIFLLTSEKQWWQGTAINPFDVWR